MAYEKNLDSPAEDEFLLPKFSRAPITYVWPWVLSTVLLSIVTIALSLQMVSIRSSDSCPNRILHAWRKSDLPAARDVIEHEDVLFYGNNAFNEEGGVYIPNDSPIDYISDPSPEVDDAWRNLTGERDFLISPKEAYELWGNDRDKHWHYRKNGYSIGLDLFHTLHCLDNLRKFYYPDYYHIPEEHMEISRLHRGHCIDQIRQYVMCAGDMTPYGTTYFPNPGRNYADSDVVHTCRNFGKIREWVRNRYHAGGALNLPDVDIWDVYRESNHQGAW